MKAHKKLPISDGIEALRDVGTPVIDTLKTETNASIDALWKQLLGAGENASVPNHGDLSEGQPIDLSAYRQKREAAKSPIEFSKTSKPDNIIHAENRFSRAAAGIDYHAEILHGEKRISKETEMILSQQIEQITVELKQLVNTSQALASEFKDVAVDQHVTKAGTYHVSLFSFILSIVRQAREKIEHSGAWLATAKGRKQKQGYWDMFNDQGTSFSMNNERSVATQAG